MAAVEGSSFESNSTRSFCRFDAQQSRDAKPQCAIEPVDVRLDADHHVLQSRLESAYDALDLLARPLSLGGHAHVEAGEIRDPVVDDRFIQLAQCRRVQLASPSSIQQILQVAAQRLLQPDEDPAPSELRDDSRSGAALSRIAR